MSQQIGQSIAKKKIYYLILSGVDENGGYILNLSSTDEDPTSWPDSLFERLFLSKVPKGKFWASKYFCPDEHAADFEMFLKMITGNPRLLLAFKIFNFEAFRLGVDVGQSLFKEDILKQVAQQLQGAGVDTSSSEDSSATSELGKNSDDESDSGPDNPSGSSAN